MKKPNFIIKPGNVISKTDGDVHHISFSELRNLYGLSMSQCIDGTNLRTTKLNFNQIYLEPDTTGNYNLAEQVHLQIENNYKPVIKYNAEEAMKDSYNSMSLFDRIYLAFTKYD